MHVMHFDYIHQYMTLSYLHFPPFPFLSLLPNPILLHDLLFFFRFYKWEKTCDTCLLRILLTSFNMMFSNSIHFQKNNSIS
jgi:hypothetical protein